MVDLEKSEKLPKERRYFNISIIWIFYFRYVIKILYRLRIPHELVTLLSIGFGLLSGYLFYLGNFLFAALTLHLKDVFDASDGALARLTGRGHLIGRYLDSLGDFLSLTVVMGAIAIGSSAGGNTQYLFWGGAAILSTFIQCSFFNYYQLAYVETFGIKTLSSKRDETVRDDLDREYKSVYARAALAAMRFLYLIVYSWQDKLVASVDNLIYGKSGISDQKRFGSKTLMILQSALCFGTHIFVIIIFALFGNPKYALIFISTAMNIYLFILLYLRKGHYGSFRSVKTIEAAQRDNGVKEKL